MSGVSPMVEALCDNVIRMAERGELPPRMGQLARVVVQNPHEGLLAIVQQAALDPAKMDDAELDRLLAQPADAASRGVNRFAGTAPVARGRGIVAEVEDEFVDRDLPFELKEMAWDLNFELLGDIRHIEEIFSEAVKNGLREELFRKAEISSNAFDIFLSILGKRIGERLFWRSGVAHGRSGTLPPLPSSKDFIEFAKWRVKTSEDAMVESWRDTALWRMMSVELFVGILPYYSGAPGTDELDGNERMRSSIEHKERWHKELTAMGATHDEMEEVLYGNIFRDEPYEKKLLASAELARFADVEIEPFTEQNRSERLDLLAHSIKELHKRDLHYSRSHLSHSEFMSSLPPLLEDMSDMSFDMIADAMAGAGHPEARNILYWHFKPGVRQGAGGGRTCGITSRPMLPRALAGLRPASAMLASGLMAARKVV